MADKSKYLQAKRLSIIGFTIVIIVLPFCLYYLLFVTSQTAYFSKRNFRVLSDIGDYMVSRVDILGENLVNLAKQPKQKVEKKEPAVKPREKPAAEVKKLEAAATLVPNLQINSKQAPQMQAQAQSRYPVWTTINAQATRAPVGSNSNSVRPTSNANSSRPSNSNASRPEVTSNTPVRRHRIRRIPTASVQGQRQADSGKDSTHTVTITVIPGEDSYRLNLEYQGPDNSTITGGQDLKTLFSPFVSQYVFDELNETRERVFDDVLIAEQSESGRVIFEQGPAGLSVVSLDNLMNDKGGKIELKLSDQSSSVFNIRLADTDYKMFLQPLRLTLSSKDDKTKQGVRWVVCGLTRADHFRDETFAVSYTVLILFVFVVLLAILSWPLLKLKLMGPKDRLRRAELGLTAIGALLGTAAITFILLDAHTYLSLEETLDDQLKKLSADIKNNFQSELGHALKELALLNKRISNLPKDQQTDATRALSQSKLDPRSEPRLSKPSSSPTLSARQNILLDEVLWRGEYGDPYPYFNSATWTDPKGEQRIKWTTRAATTTFVNVADRRFFKDAQNSNAWKLRYDNVDYDYQFELLTSRNTGENLAIIATRVNSQKGPSWVSNLDIRMSSLMGAVLPAGFGFAVIDEGGRVIFHADEVKDLKEEFFAESENNSKLRAAVLSRTDRLVNANYLGSGHRLFVSPVSGTDWVLVVFRDKELGRTINLEVLTLSVTLYLGFALIMAALILSIYLPKQAERLRWLWPDPTRGRRYEWMIVANILIGLIFVACLLIRSPWLLIVCCVIIPVIAIVLGALMLRRTEAEQFSACETNSTSARFLSYRAAYAVSMVGFVTLISVLPPVGFFDIARNFELRLLVKYGQVTLTKGIERREQKIRSQYALVNVADRIEANPKISGKRAQKPKAEVAWRDAKESFIEKRLGISSDVYDTFFFDSRISPVRSATTADGFFPETVSVTDSLLARIRPLYNQSCIESQELANGSSSDGLWTWKKDAAGSLRLDKEKSGTPGALSLAVTSRLPDLVHPDTLPKVIGLVVIIGLLLLMIYGLVRFVARRFFLLDLELPNSFARPQSYVLLRDRYIGNGKQWNPSEFWVTDLRSVTDWTKWRDELNQSPSKPLPVVFDYFDKGKDQPQANAEKLKAIEALLASNRSIVVVTSVDPLSFSLGEPQRHAIASLNGSQPIPAEIGALVQNEADGPEPSPAVPYPVDSEMRARWIAVFAGLPTVFELDRSSDGFAENNMHFLSILKTRKPWRYVEEIGKGIVLHGSARIAGRGRNRSRDEEHLSQIGEQARALHHAIWDSCTEGQRCTLIQLAQDGMLCPTNKHLRRLVKRGLIVRDPELRLMDESFRRFIISMSNEQDIEAWRRQDGGSAWQLLKVPLMLVLVGIALFLFITQKDVYDSTISFLSAATAGIAALFKLLGMFQSSKPTSGASP